jgi:Salmonella virulence plasmid 65kDa B protein
VGSWWRKLRRSDSPDWEGLPGTDYTNLNACYITTRCQPLPRQPSIRRFLRRHRAGASRSRQQRVGWRASDGRAAFHRRVSRFASPRNSGSPRESQPSVGIHYSSAAGIREAGIGWGLELPAIERRSASGCPPTYVNPEPKSSNVYPYWQISPETLDARFTFNGEPLVPICEVGSPADCTGVDDRTLPGWLPTGWAKSAGISFRRL